MLKLDSKRVAARFIIRAAYPHRVFKVVFKLKCTHSTDRVSPISTSSKVLRLHDSGQIVEKLLKAGLIS